MAVSQRALISSSQSSKVAPLAHLFAPSSSEKKCDLLKTFQASTHCTELAICDKEKWSPLKKINILVMRYVRHTTNSTLRNAWEDGYITLLKPETLEYSHSLADPWQSQIGLLNALTAKCPHPFSSKRPAGVIRPVENFPRWNPKEEISCPKPSEW